MKARTTLCILGAWGTLILAGGQVFADETPVAELVATGLKSEKDADKVKALDELGARGEKAAEADKPIEGLLKDKSAKVRAHAALALGSIRAKDSVPALAELMKDSNDMVRRSAVRAIFAIHPGPKIMIPICTKLLEDSDPAVRGRVLAAVAERGAEAVPGLIEALKDDKVAFWALIVLRDIGPEAKEAVPAIAEKLKDKRADIRREAVLTLGAMGAAAKQVVPQIAALVSDKHAATAATFVLGELGQIPQDVEPVVRANAKSDDLMLSTTSLWALTLVHPEDKDLRRETTEKLVARLKDKDAFVRVAAARGLAALPPAPEITLPIFEKALKDADETTIRHAMDALAALGAAAVPRLTDALKHEKFRADVAYALGRIGPDAAPATGALAKLIDDKNSRVAEEAIIALGDIGPGAKEAVPDLVKALDEPEDVDMKFAAIAFALGKIGPAAADAAEPVLIKKLRSKDENLRVLSGWALAQVSPKSAEVAAKAAPVLAAGLSSAKELGDRVLAAEGLGNFGPLAKTATDALKKASADPSKELQEAAAKALKAIEQSVATVVVKTPEKPATPEKPVASAATPLRPGDLIVTVEDKVEVGVKGSQGEIVSKGTKLKVYEIRGTWIGVQIVGSDKTGWVLQEQVARP